MKLIETAITERTKQLQRQENSAANPMIKEILKNERLELAKEWAEMLKKK